MHATMFQKNKNKTEKENKNLILKLECRFRFLGVIMLQYSCFRAGNLTQDDLVHKH